MGFSWYFAGGMRNLMESSTSMFLDVVAPPCLLNPTNCSQVNVVARKHGCHLSKGTNSIDVHLGMVCFWELPQRDGSKITGSLHATPGTSCLSMFCLANNLAHNLLFGTKSLEWYLREITAQLWLMGVFCLCRGWPSMAVEKMTIGKVEVYVPCH